MKTVLVASSKGGVGKTTLSTNLAARFALDGKRTVLVDADRQGSSRHWATKRAHLEHAVLPVDGTRRDWDRKVPDDAQRVIVDAAAGSHADELEHFLNAADAVVVPIMPSTIDMEATVPFLDSLAKHPRIRKGKLPVGLVGNRLRPWTTASQQSMDTLRQWPYPLVAELRDTQAYVLMAGLGRSLFDYQSQQVREHQADWAPLLKWLKRA
ncbi:ParA family protein [Lysobacter sp. KIS68-7]|uniref:ParA family protein n=1 Tax=Lysobacter sp. KIS68-7 TaxID=2904252 RepID=UPI001E406161|nr:ParA family protein [Lysobacter sp. KIS68-7]UHQ20527.1 ParA family protein [Lysobacter sp. KIS68-7]